MDKYYSIFRSEYNSTYAHVKLTINDVKWRADANFSVEWQETIDKRGELYGGHFNLLASDPKNVESFMRVFKNLYFYQDFAGVCDRLQERGYVFAAKSDPFYDIFGKRHMGLVNDNLVHGQRALLCRAYAGLYNLENPNGWLLSSSCDPAALRRSIEADFPTGKYHGREIYYYSDPVGATNFLAQKDLHEFYYTNSPK